jgi:hypothetical protein
MPDKPMMDRRTDSEGMVAQQLTKDTNTLQAVNGPDEEGNSSYLFIIFFFPFWIIIPGLLP